MDMEIEIITLKDETELTTKTNDKKTEEIEILIASVNSIEEERLSAKVILSMNRRKLKS